MISLDVPYYSQWDADSVWQGKKATGTCIETCLKMLLEYYGTKTTIEQLIGLADGDPLKTDFNSAKRASDSFGVPLWSNVWVTLDQLKGYLNLGKPVIATINYGMWHDQQDQTFKGTHAVLVRGYNGRFVYINDPDYQGSRRQDGDNKKYTFDDFFNAWHGTNPKEALAGSCLYPIKQKEEPMSDYQRWFEECERRALEVSKTTGVVRPGDGRGTIIANLEHCAFLTGKVKDLEKENADLKKSVWVDVSVRIKKALGY